MMGAFEIFAIVASAIALVFLNWSLFRLTRFPPGVLFILLGAVLSAVGTKMPKALEDTVILSVPILIGAILFGCGLKMNLRGIAKHRGSILLSLLTLALTGGATWWIGYNLLGLGLYGSILLASICAGMGSFFVFHIVDTVNLGDGVADTLSLESSMTEAGALVVGLAVFQLNSGASALQATALGVVFGLLAGILWVRLIRYASDFPHRDALTLAIVLGVAALCEGIFPTSGMASALFFGIAMGNANLLKSSVNFEWLLKFQEDVLMAGGTFFFFYVGLIAGKLDPWAVLAGVGLWLLVVAIRAVSIYISIREEGFSLAIAGLTPKGLSAVLIAQSAVAAGLLVSWKLYAYAVPIVVLSGIHAGLSPLVKEGVRPEKIDAVVESRIGKTDDAGDKIKHAYDIEEVKRSMKVDGLGKEDCE